MRKYIQKKFFRTKYHIELRIYTYETFIIQIWICYLIQVEASLIFIAKSCWTLKQNNSTDETNWEKRIYKGLTFERNKGTVDRSIEQFRVGNFAITIESQSPCLCELT